MGFLDGLIGGAVGAEAMHLVEGVIQQNGGIEGLVQHFEQNGLGAIARSWVGTGANQSVTPDQLHDALGGDTVSKLSAQTGLDPQTLLAQIAQHLPGAVDKMTPNGTVAS